MSSEYMTTIRLRNGKHSELGRLGICVTIDNEPECFEFSNEERQQALELLKKNAKHFNNDDDGYQLKLFFADEHETNWVDVSQLGTAEKIVMRNLIRLAGLK